MLRADRIAGPPDPEKPGTPEPWSVDAATGFGAGILDIDVRRPGRELVVRYGNDADRKPHVVYVFTNGRVTASPALWSSRLELDGKGKVEASHHFCGRSVRQTWTLGPERLVRIAERRSGRLSADACVD